MRTHAAPIACDGAHARHVCGCMRVQATCSGNITYPCAADTAYVILSIMFHECACGHTLQSPRRAMTIRELSPYAGTHIECAAAAHTPYFSTACWSKHGGSAAWQQARPKTRHCRLAPTNGCVEDCGSGGCLGALLAAGQTQCHAQAPLPSAWRRALPLPSSLPA